MNAARCAASLARQLEGARYERITRTDRSADDLLMQRRRAIVSLQKLLALAVALAQTSETDEQAWLVCTTAIRNAVDWLDDANTLPRNELGCAVEPWSCEART